jgi:hypothetical protein
MDFEEFFKKKRIDLDALQKVEPALFSEFKTHFGLMGEKSFDHTKKYWFNKLRLQFPAPAEVKTEKVKIDNPLAEQTITESLIEETVTPPKLGFVPKFKAANIPKPAATDTPAEAKPEGQPGTTPAPKLGFTPKFRAASPPKPVAEQAEPAKTEETPNPASALKLGFTPKFKAANMPKPVAEPDKPAATEEPKDAPEAENTEAKPAYKPRFNMKNLPKKEE